MVTVVRSSAADNKSVFSAFSKRFSSSLSSASSSAVYSATHPHPLSDQKGNFYKLLPIGQKPRTFFQSLSGALDRRRVHDGSEDVMSVLDAFLHLRVEACLLLECLLFIMVWLVVPHKVDGFRCRFVLRLLNVRLDVSQLSIQSMLGVAYRCQESGKLRPRKLGGGNRLFGVTALLYYANYDDFECHSVKRPPRYNSQLDLAPR